MFEEGENGALTARRGSFGGDSWAVGFVSLGLMNSLAQSSVCGVGGRAGWSQTVMVRCGRRTIVVCMGGARDKTRLRGLELLERDWQDLMHSGSTWWASWRKPAGPSGGVVDDGTDVGLVVEEAVELRSLTAQTVMQAVLKSRDQLATAAMVLVGRVRAAIRVGDQLLTVASIGSRESVSRWIEMSKGGPFYGAALAVARIQDSVFGENNRGSRGKGWSLLSSFRWQGLDREWLSLGGNYLAKGSAQGSRAPGDEKPCPDVHVAEISYPVGLGGNEEAAQNVASLLQERKRERRRLINSWMLQNSKRGDGGILVSMVAKASTSMLAWAAVPLRKQLDDDKIGQNGGGRSAIVSIAQQLSVLPASGVRGLLSLSKSRLASNKADTNGHENLIAKTWPGLFALAALGGGAVTTLSSASLAVAALAMASIAHVVDQASSSTSVSPDFSLSSVGIVQSQTLRKLKTYHSKKEGNSSVRAQESQNHAIGQSQEGITSFESRGDLDTKARSPSFTKTSLSSKAHVVYSLDSIMLIIERILGRMFRRLVAAGLIRDDSIVSWRLLRSLSIKRGIY